MRRKPLRSQPFAGPHAVSSVAGTKNANYCYDNVGNLTQGDGRTVAWTAFNMPSQFVQGLRTINITYGPDRARFKRVDVNETPTSTTYYVAGGGHEVVTSGTTVTHKTYIAGVAVVIETTSTPTSTQTIYLLKDHLGSTDVITDSTGMVQTRYSFDAWGQRRDVNWAAFFPTVPTSLWQNALTTRGYTGHEELDEVGLVHMNGRVYDPQLGRFLSADSFIQNPSDLQSLNRYSYVQNNPLSFTDPTGHFLSGLFNTLGHFASVAWHAIGSAIKSFLKNPLTLFRAVFQIAICATPGVGPFGCAAAAAGFTLFGGGGTPLQALRAFAFAYISVNVWTQVGQYLRGVNAIFGDGVAANDFLTKGLVHGIVGGTLSLAQGGHFLQGFAANAIGADVGLLAGGFTNDMFLHVAIVGVAGGFAAQLTGGKFANGALTAAFADLYNYFNKEGTAAQIKKIDEALDLLKNDPRTADLYNRLAVSPYPFTIRGNDLFDRSPAQTSFERYQSGGGIINWNPFAAFLDIASNASSPIVALAHELGHATLGFYVARALDQASDPIWKNAEEKYVTQKYEWPAADAFGGVRRDCYCANTDTYRSQGLTSWLPFKP